MCAHNWTSPSIWVQICLMLALVVEGRFFLLMWILSRSLKMVNFSGNFMACLLDRFSRFGGSVVARMGSFNV